MRSLRRVEIAMIEWIALGYEVVKDAVAFARRFSEYTEESMVVDREWTKKSGLEAEAQAKGWTLYWSRPDHIPSREIDGWRVLCVIDRDSRIVSRIVRYDESTLLVKGLAD